MNNLNLKSKLAFYIKITCVLIVSLVVTGCDWVNNIVVIENKTNDSLYATYAIGKLPTDSIVNDRYRYLKTYIIAPDSSKTVHTFNLVLSKQPDTAKIYLYIFNVDSLNKYQKANRFKGIFLHSLLKKTVIQLNKVKEPVDTIEINKPVKRKPNG